MLHCLYEGMGEPAGSRWAEVLGVHMEQDMELEALAEALEALPERERDVIVLHYYHGLTLKEVAIHMRLAYSTVKLCHNRTLERLQQMLAPEEATV